MKIDPTTGLHVPDDYEPPKAKSGGWPPVLDIPDDAKVKKCDVKAGSGDSYGWVQVMENNK